MCTYYDVAGSAHTALDEGMVELVSDVACYTVCHHCSDEQGQNGSA